MFLMNATKLKIHSLGWQALVIKNKGNLSTKGFSKHCFSYQTFDADPVKSTVLYINHVRYKCTYIHLAIHRCILRYSGIPSLQVEVTFLKNGNLGPVCSHDVPFEGNVASACVSFVT